MIWSWDLRGKPSGLVRSDLLCYGRRTHPEPLRNTITELPLPYSCCLGSLLDLHPMLVRSCIEQYLSIRIPESSESCECISKYERVEVANVGC